MLLCNLTGTICQPVQSRAACVFDPSSPILVLLLDWPLNRLGAGFGKCDWHDSLRKNEELANGHSGVQSAAATVETV